MDDHDLAIALAGDADAVRDAEEQGRRAGIASGGADGAAIG